MKKLSIFYYSTFTTITPPLTIKLHPTQKNEFSETFCYKMIKRGIFNIQVLNNKHVGNTKSMTSVAKKFKHIIKC